MRKENKKERKKWNKIKKRNLKSINYFYMLF